MEEFVLHIAKSLVSQPDDVHVCTTLEGDVSVMRITADENDIGKLIGRNGKIATSIRTIVRSVSKKNGNRIVIKIGDK